MAVSRDVARVNFARFVQRTLATARARGMTDRAISQATGVGPSTFHRWRRAEWGRTWPELDKVIAFCRGLDIDVDEAIAALGFSAPGERRQPPIPADLDPDLRLLLRKLADPKVNAATKHFIVAQLQYLAQIADQLPEPEPRRRAS